MYYYIVKILFHQVIKTFFMKINISVPFNLGEKKKIDSNKKCKVLS